MKTRIILSIAVALFSLMSGMAGQWTFNPQTGRLRHDESGWILLAEANGARNLTIVKTIAAPTGTVPLNDPVNGGYTVTALDDTAFFECRTLRTFISAETLATTDGNAFYDCANLTNLVLSKKANRNFDLSLSGAQHVSTITIPVDNPYLKSIDGVVFSADGSVLIRCPPTRKGNYQIPDGVREIEKLAFASCSGLNAILLPDSVCEIGTSAFAGCTGLTHLDLPNGISSISQWAFGGCTNVEQIILPDALTRIAGGLFYGCTKLRSVALPPHLEAIGDSAFAECSALEELDIPDGPTSLGFCTFRDCTSLKRIRLPGTLTQLNENEFQDCPALKSIHLPKSLLQSKLFILRQFLNLNTFSVDEANPDFKAIDGVLFSKDGQTLIAFPRGRCGAYTIPSGVRNIADSAFFGCRKLTAITVPDGVKIIGEVAFGQCSSLLSIELPDSIREIGRQAFMECTSLRSVRLPEGLEKLSTGLFLKCHNLRTVSVPNSVRLMEGSVFQDCDGLESISLPASLDEVNRWEFGGCLGITNISVSSKNPNYRDIDGVLFNKSGETLIKYPSGRKGDYSIPEGVRILALQAFARCKGLQNVIIPESVVNIEAMAFEGAENLRRVVIPDSVTNIGTSAFISCEKLESIKLPAHLVRIPDSLCYACPTLTTVVFPDTLEAIGDSAFNFCPKLILERLPDRLRIIGQRAFGEIHTPSILYFPKQLQEIGDKAFAHCPDLEHVVIPSNLSRLDDEAFANCPKLKSVIFNGAYPETVGEDILQGSNSATTFVTRAFAASWDTDVSFGPIGAEHAIWQGRPIVYVGATAQSNAPVPEAWQIANFKKATAAAHTPLGTHDDDDYDPDGDPDGDGMTNAQEYVAGTDPNDADSVFRALITVENGQVKIHWEPDLGETRVYTIEGKVNLTDKEWVSPASQDCRFFRVRVDLPPE